MQPVWRLFDEMVGKQDVKIQKKKIQKEDSERRFRKGKVVKKLKKKIQKEDSEKKKKETRSERRFRKLKGELRRWRSRGSWWR